MADEQPNDASPPGAEGPPAIESASPPPLAQQYYPPLYPPAGQPFPQAEALPPMAGIASQPGFPVFAPPVTAPYGTPYGAPYGVPPGYRETYDRPRRPGVLTAIAVISIVMSVIGSLGAVVAIAGATAFLISGDAAASLQVRRATETASAPPDAPVATVKASPGPNGMEEADRTLTFQALSQLEPIGEERQKQLDLVLTLAGKGMFPKAGALTSIEALQAMVKNHGEMFSAKADAQGASYFITEGGRLDLYDDRAVFRPTDGSATVRVAANPPPPIGFTAEEVESVLSQVQIATHNALNTPQQAALRTLLLDPAQGLVPPNRVSNAVASTSNDAGVVTLKFAGGSGISLGPQGETLAPGEVPPPKVNRVLFGCVVGLIALSLALAIYLFVGAVQIFRGKFTSSQKIHVRYAILKLGTTLGLIVFAIWMRGDFITRFEEALESAHAASTTPNLPAWAPRLIALAPLGFIYPIILLVVLRLRGVRTHLEAKPGARLF